MTAFLTIACLMLIIYAASAAALRHGKMGNDLNSLSEESLTVGFTRIEENNYFFDNEGSLVTGWIVIKQEDIDSEANSGLIGWHFAGPDGVLATGFRQINGQVYCFDESTTTMVTGHGKIGESEYEFANDGILIEGDWSISQFQ